MKTRKIIRERLADIPKDRHIMNAPQQNVVDSKVAYYRVSPKRLDQIVETWFNLELNWSDDDDNEEAK